MDDEQAIRDLFTGWVEAVQSQELEGVVADHDPKIVMFDVPPPYDGVRGIEEYRKSWPPFFEWLRQGAQFQLLELHVTAGADVAFAYALLRCGTQDHFDANPDNRLRITVGLRKLDGRWVVAHEHHSFPMTDTAS
ncbi:YybH family protein [Mycolicibacterium stellerae]|uniref:YybH family protein n=1 Tax=Mycolicibacterium stellerae TaxID=2358193 RepID=UPI000F0B5C7A|nr:nuclear transport factor 2 family protein [Mycolicibacterium stellerae]